MMTSYIDNNQGFYLLLLLLSFISLVNPLPPDPGVYSGARTQRPKKPKKNNNNIFANSLTTFTSDFYLQRYCMQQKF